MRASVRACVRAVPAGWGHTALNLEDSIGIAIGFRDAFATPMYINDQW